MNINNYYFMNGGHPPVHCCSPVYYNNMFAMNPPNIGLCIPNLFFYQPQYDASPTIVHPTIYHYPKEVPHTRDDGYPNDVPHTKEDRSMKGVPTNDWLGFCEAEPLLKANKIKRLRNVIRQLKRDIRKMGSCFRQYQENKTR